MTRRAFQAYGPAGRFTAESPLSAALGFFRAFPKARRCTVVEGEDDGHSFVVRYGRASAGEWPQSWKDITPRTAALLPAACEAPAPRSLSDTVDDTLAQLRRP